MVTYGGSIVIIATDYIVTIIMNYLVDFQKPKSITSRQLYIAKKLWKVRLRKLSQDK